MSQHDSETGFSFYLWLTFFVVQEFIDFSL